MSTGLKGSIWAVGGRSRVQNAPSQRASSQPSRPPPPPTTTSEPTISAPTEPAVSVQAISTQAMLPPAPAPLSSSNPPSSRLTSSQAFHRFEQACQRLRWKYVDLQNSYHRALNPESSGFPVGEAEKNFKVDFHEFYVWIEQALVLLLLVFDIMVPQSSRRGRDEKHRYHHDVLTTLENKTGPLYEALGKGEVNMALWKAKELRNQWKDVKDGNGKETAPLKMYDLTWIVTQILSGLEAGYGLASRKVEMDSRGRSWADDFDDEVVMAEDDQWEWMVEPMDWESVGG
ncbi:uncharacterized protein FIESC28_07781 [Fusarium coffeatum]|uniref:Uncharacterized protein n=1 Tax=Fusarium coffeatum TaxID=231269 RepID=A0A366RB27_9HYPO|nr:uncharacterized protein FIESC28_07781 [Fusarium coffeatum]RBR14351.1 hypothetical protein FIESC28_07781 [Fusarium coffeatum]